MLNFFHARKAGDGSTAAGRIVTSVQNFCMCILQQNLFLQKKQNKTKNYILYQTRWLKFGLNLHTHKIALNGKQRHKCVHKHTDAHVYQQSNSW